MNYTNGDIAKLLEFAGVDTTPRCKWCGWSKASCDEKAICLLTNGGIHCVEPMPPLTGDFADVVAMRCLRQLAHIEGIYVESQSCSHPDNGSLLARWVIRDEDDKVLSQAIEYDPADAIFAATLAYLKEQEGK